MEEATRAYDLIMGNTREFFLGTLLTYADAESAATLDVSDLSAKIPVAAVANSSGSIGLGVLGAGNFAQNTLLPALKAISGVSFIGVCNATGPRSRSAAEKFGFSYCSNSETELLQDSKIKSEERRVGKEGRSRWSPY